MTTLNMPSLRNQVQTYYYRLSYTTCVFHFSATRFFTAMPKDKGKDSPDAEKPSGRALDFGLKERSGIRLNPEFSTPYTSGEMPLFYFCCLIRCAYSLRRSDYDGRENRGGRARGMRLPWTGSIHIHTRTRTLGIRTLALTPHFTGRKPPSGAVRCCCSGTSTKPL
jgi:hypothetical protein